MRQHLPALRQGVAPLYLCRSMMLLEVLPVVPNSFRDITNTLELYPVNARHGHVVAGLVNTAHTYIAEQYLPLVKKYVETLKEAADAGMTQVSLLQHLALLFTYASGLTIFSDPTTIAFADILDDVREVCRKVVRTDTAVISGLENYFRTRLTQIYKVEKVAHSGDLADRLFSLYHFFIIQAQPKQKQKSKLPLIQGLRPDIFETKYMNYFSDDKFSSIYTTQWTSEILQVVMAEEADKKLGQTGRNIVEKLPSETFDSIKARLLDIYYPQLLKYVADAEKNTRMDGMQLNSFRANKVESYLRSMRSELRLDLLKRYAKERDGDGVPLISSEDLRDVVSNLNFVPSDPWTLDVYKSGSESSLVAARLESYSTLLEKAFATMEKDIFFDAFQHILQNTANDAPTTRLKAYVDTVNSIIHKMEYNRSNAIKMFGAGEDEDNSAALDQLMRMVSEIQSSPDNDNKASLLAYVTSLGEQMQQLAYCGFKEKCNDHPEPEIKWTSSQARLFDLGVELNWQVSRYSVGEKEAEERFSIEVSSYKPYTDVRGSKARRVEASLLIFSVLLQTYERYIGKFWVIKAKEDITSVLLRRIESLMDVVEGIESDVPVLDEFVSTLVSYASKGAVPNSMVLDVKRFIMERGHLGRHGWQQRNEPIRKYVKAVVTGWGDHSAVPEMFQTFLSMRLPYSRKAEVPTGSKNTSGQKTGRAVGGGRGRGAGGRGRGRGGRRPAGVRVKKATKKVGLSRSRKDKLRYAAMRAKLVQELMESSPSAIHIRIVWAFLTKFRQDLLVPFLAEGPRNPFKGPFTCLAKSSNIVSIDTTKEKERQAEAYLFPGNYGLTRFYPKSLQPLADLLSTLMLSKNYPVPKRARFAYRYARLPHLSFRDFLPFIQSSTGNELPGVVTDQLISMSLHCDEPRAPFYFLFSEDVLSRTDDGVMMNIINSSLKVVDPSKNKGHLAVMVDGLVRNAARRGAMSQTLHRAILKLLKFDPCSLANDILCAEVKDRASPMLIRSTALRSILEFIVAAEPDSESTADLWAVLDLLVGEEFNTIEAEEAATLLCLLPDGPKKDKDTFVDARCGSAAWAEVSTTRNASQSSASRNLMPLMNKAGVLNSPHPVASKYFNNVLWKVYSRSAEKEKEVKEGSSKKAKTLSSHTMLLDWKQMLLGAFETWSYVADLRDSIIAECASLVVHTCLGDDTTEAGSPPIALDLLTKIREAQVGFLITAPLRTISCGYFRQVEDRKAAQATLVHYLRVVRHLQSLLSTTTLNQVERIKFLFVSFVNITRTHLSGSQYFNYKKKADQFLLQLIRDDVEPMQKTLKAFAALLQDGDVSSSINIFRSSLIRFEKEEPEQEEQQQPREQAWDTWNSSDNWS